MLAVALLADSVTAARRFTSLSDRAKHIRIATAWATEGTAVSSALFRNRRKIDTIAVGISFGNTDPAFLKRFRAKTRAVLPRAGITFHPKVYLFIGTNRFEAIIGSSNLTSGGFGNNLEANLLVSGSTHDPLFGDIERMLDGLSDGAVPISETVLRVCEKQWRVWRRLRAGAGGAVLKGTSAGAPTGRKPPLTIFVGWSDYCKILSSRGGRGHDLFPTAKSMGYVGVIGAVGRIFARKRTLAAMTKKERTRVAGLTHDEFATYGSTYMVGYFANLVRTKPQLIDRALSCIPFPPAPVTHQDFMQFVKKLPKGSRLGSSGVGSRLLSMKRPDLFVGVNSKNGPGLAKEFGVAPTTLNNYARYWTLHEAIWQCPWFKSPRPRGRQGLLWDARVALLDHLYYHE